MRKADKMDQELHEAMVHQRDRFIEKFRREPTSEDPIFFDPDCDMPTPHPTKRNSFCYKVSVSGQSNSLRDKYVSISISKLPPRRAPALKAFSGYESEDFSLWQ